MLKKYLGIVLLVVFTAACSGQMAAGQPGVLEALSFPGQVTATLTPFQPVKPTSTPTLPPEPKIWVSNMVPQELKENIANSAGMLISETQQEANLELIVAGEQDYLVSLWVYTLVAPFPTAVDGVSLEDIQNTWKGQPSGVFAGRPLMMTESTHAAFAQLWGDSSGDGIKIFSQDELIDIAWAQRPSWALIPFEQLEPRWKVLKVDGASPIDQNLDLEAYPLVIPFGFSGDTRSFQLVQDGMSNGTLFLPATNRNPERMTVVVVTGVTALVRAIGAKMETKGMTWPAEDIKNWLLDADFTHISNEVSFDPNCPQADPYQEVLRFCSRVEYMELLDYIDVDVIELSGNHVMDWGKDAMLYTLQMYQDKNLPYYAGGTNLEEARKPVLFEHNGNKIAFIGCNPAGPPSDWATTTDPGAANCEDYGWIIEEIKQLRSEGYLPVVTLQYNEHYDIAATSFQKQDFPPLAQAGAVIVSGSQAHYPNGMEFSGDALIHYGLGNLFFDQMDFLVPGIQREFVDRHIFYDGRYISTEILTAYLEDFGRPRPMTAEERTAFLQEAFSASGW